MENNEKNNQLKIYKEVNRKKAEITKIITILNVPNRNLSEYYFDKNLLNFPNLIKLDCSYNDLETLSLKGNPLIIELNASFNKLTDFKWNQLKRNIKTLDISNNNLKPTDMIVFQLLFNLEKLSIGTYEDDRIKEGLYNRFYGALHHLKNSIKLNHLIITYTDIDCGIEWLPTSLLNINGGKILSQLHNVPSQNERKISKLKNDFIRFQDDHASFMKEKHEILMKWYADNTIQFEESLLKPELFDRLNASIILCFFVLLTKMFI